jgi:hypothetical protein
MARSGMANLITQLRAHTHAGTADYTLAGVSYWTDDQLQDILDGQRQTHTAVRLLPVTEVAADGSHITQEYHLPPHLRHVEEAGTASGWRVYQADGSDAPTHTVNYAAGVVAFAADTDNLAVYLACRTYHMHLAAAAVWEKKAAAAVDAVDWATDGQNIRAEQEYAHCTMMAAYFRMLAGPATSRLVRRDEEGGGWP